MHYSQIPPQHSLLGRISLRFLDLSALIILDFSCAKVIHKPFTIIPIALLPATSNLILRAFINRPNESFPDRSSKIGKFARLNYPTTSSDRPKRIQQAVRSRLKEEEATKTRRTKKPTLYLHKRKFCIVCKTFFFKFVLFIHNPHFFIPTPAGFCIFQHFLLEQNINCHHHPTL